MQKNGWGSPLKLRTSNLGNGDVAIGPNQAAPAFLRKEAKGMQPTKKKLMNINLEEHSQVILDSACKIKPNAGKKLWHSLWNIGGSSLFHGQLRYQHPEKGNSNPRQWLNKKHFLPLSHFGKHFDGGTVVPWQGSSKFLKFWNQKCIKCHEPMLKKNNPK